MLSSKTKRILFCSILGGWLCTYNISLTRIKIPPALFFCTDVSSNEAAARGGGPERRAASWMAAQTAGAGPSHLQIHQYLWDPRVLHPTGGGERRLWPHSNMSSRTDLLCHSGSLRRKTNVKHLECGGNTKEHLEKRRFYFRLALTVQTSTPATTTDLVQETDGSDEVLEEETKRWVGRWFEELQQKCTTTSCRCSSTCRVAQLNDFNCFQRECS